MKKILFALILSGFSFNVFALWTTWACTSSVTPSATCGETLATCVSTPPAHIVIDGPDENLRYQGDGVTIYSIEAPSHWYYDDTYSDYYGNRTCTWVGEQCLLGTTYNIATGECVTTLPDTPPITKPVKTFGTPSCGSINSSIGGN